MKRLKNFSAIPSISAFSFLNAAENTIPFEVFSCEARETLACQGQPLHCFYLVFQGSVRFYGLHLDGQEFSITLQHHEGIVGSVEYLLNLPSPYFAETVTPCLIAKIPFSSLKEKDVQATALLFCIARSLAENQLRICCLEREQVSLEARILHYVRFHPVVRVQELVLNLHCSRRHLQRTLKRLVEKKELIRLRQGVYALFNSLPDKSKTELSLRQKEAESSR